MDCSETIHISGSLEAQLFPIFQFCYHSNLRTSVHLEKPFLSIAEFGLQQVSRIAKWSTSIPDSQFL